MDAAQKTLLFEVIDADCQISGQFMNELGQTCAIGALALEAGFDADRMKSKQVWTKVFQKVEAHYGLTHYQSSKIMDLNDLYFTPEERRAAIREYVDTLEVVERKHFWKELKAALGLDRDS
jgi:hypothetical protein